MKPVLCFGDICADLILPYGAARRAARKEPVDPSQTEVVFSHGGSVANTAAGLAKLGIPVQFCGTCGDDAYGYTLKEELRRSGVDVSMLKIQRGIPTLLIAIIVDENGERTALCTQRTHASQHQVTQDQLPSDILDSIGWLHCSGVLLREDPAASVQLALMRKCRARKIPVSFDINARIEARGDAFFYRNLRQAFEACDVLFGSLTDELPLLCGSFEPDAIRMLTEGGRIVIARDGSNGAVLYTETETIPCPAFPVPVVDAIGAGDTYDAGWIAARMRGAPLRQANRYANAAGAYCVMHAGGRACPDWEQLIQFSADS